MNEVRILAAAPGLGSGFSDEAFQEGLKLGPHAICSDAGSDDLGPDYLGTCEPFHFGRNAVKRDLERMIRGAAERKIPCMVSSAGIAGTNAGVDAYADIAKEICAEHGLKVPLARIHCEIDKEQLINWMRQGRVEPLEPWIEPLQEEDVNRSLRIVGVLGAAPYVKALREGASVVIGGRTTDAAPYAAAAHYYGVNGAHTWHLGKLLECGAFCTDGPAFESVMGIIRPNDFDIRALFPSARATPSTVAAHMLYETNSPGLHREPVGTIDASGAAYTVVNDRTVRVSGTRYLETARTMKLEAVRLVGYRAVMLCVIGDPAVLKILDELLDKQSALALSRVPRDKAGLPNAERKIVFHRFGQRGLWSKWQERFGSVPAPIARRAPVEEVTVVADVVASSQDEAKSLATHLRHGVLHGTKDMGLPLDGNAAFPFIEFKAGPVYEWSVFHRVIGDAEDEIAKILHS